MYMQATVWASRGTFKLRRYQSADLQRHADAAWAQIRNGAAIELESGAAAVFNPAQVIAVVATHHEHGISQGETP